MRVISLTLEKSVQRQWFYVGGMMMRGTPYEDIYFFRGRSARDFRNDYNLIADAAEEDGFPFVRFFQGYGDTGVVRQMPAQMAQVWSYASILRHIASGDEKVLVTWDDRILTVPYPMLVELVSALDEDEREFYLFQLRLRGDNFYLDIPKETLDERFLVERELFRAFTSPAYAADYIMMFTRLGFTGYDESIVFSPKGAGWMLDQMLAMQEVDPDVRKLYYFDVAKEQKQIYNANINIDNWICHSCVKAAARAIKAGRGLYCPRYHGYEFIDDPLPMGSLTGWAASNTPDKEKINERKKIRFIN